jgi:hypothetical protein
VCEACTSRDRDSAQNSADLKSSADRAIRVAEEAASGVIDRVLEADSTCTILKEVDASMPALGSAAALAAEAAMASAEAAMAADSLPGCNPAAETAASMAAGSVAACHGDSAAGSAIMAARADFQNLVELKPSRLPGLGYTIDPSESGPLGPLWPEGSSVSPGPQAANPRA